MLSRLIKRNELKKFQKKWRRLNLHNNTFACCVFDENKVTVGNHTYGGLNVWNYYYDNEKLVIGHFCSIAGGVKFFLAGEHYKQRPTTFPVKTFFQGHKGGEGYSKGPISVGSDVWFGFDAWIMSGVTIGQGAVIGARSLIVKDVPPYAVVAGNPARIIKYRFSEEIIRELLKIDYAKLNKEFCCKYIDFLTRSLDLENLKTFINGIS